MAKIDLSGDEIISVDDPANSEDNKPIDDSYDNAEEGTSVED